MEQIENRKKRRGDRYDGWRIRNLDPMFTLIPYIMRSRLDSQIMFDEKIDITNLENFILEQRKSGFSTLSTIHIILAALVRMTSQYPQVNRFVSGGKIYARKYFRVSMTVKKSLSIAAYETTIMPYFLLNSTIHDITARYNKALDEALNTTTKNGNDTDAAARILGLLPGFIKRFFVFALRNLDKMGLMPKAIHEISPFHSGFFITNVGSLGIDPVYHHLYEFGTTSVFVAMGRKKSKRLEGETRRYMNFRFVVDERICDGFYFAAAIKIFKWCLKHPEILLLPPEKILRDI